MTHSANPDHRAVFGGVDTHHDFHVVVALTVFGVRLGHATFPTTTAGYADLCAWLQSWGPVARVGVEGTGSYGAGLARHLTQHGLVVREVNRADRSDRRRRGKSDTIDAENAARAALRDHGTATPKPGTGPVEQIRVLKRERDSAVKARTAAINQIHNLVLTAPEDLRDRLEHLPTATLLQRCRALRPTPHTGRGSTRDLTDTYKATLRRLARRVRALTEEIDDLDLELQTLVKAIAPRTLAAFGTGIETTAQLLITIGDNPERFTKEAAFAHLCGTAPIPASSGRRDRHRLNRGGDRQANSALHMIALSRQGHHAPTKAYKERRTAQGLNGKDITRCLKRHIARELYTLLKHDLRQATHPQPTAVIAA